MWCCGMRHVWHNSVVWRASLSVFLVHRSRDLMSCRHQEAHTNTAITARTTKTYVYSVFFSFGRYVFGPREGGVVRVTFLVHTRTLLREGGGFVAVPPLAPPHTQRRRLVPTRIHGICFFSSDARFRIKAPPPQCIRVIIIASPRGWQCSTSSLSCSA